MDLMQHLEKLPYFYQTALLGSFSKAAKKLFITQPSLSKSIKVLEDELGDKLFIRLPRGVKLTRSGEILLQDCHQLFKKIEDISTHLKFQDDPMAGSIKLGTYESIAIFFWPSFLHNFLSNYPNLELDLTTGRSLDIQTAVENGNLDIGLVIEPKKSKQTEIEILATDSFSLFCTPYNKKMLKDQKAAPLIYMPDAIGNEDHQTLQNILIKEKVLTPLTYKTSGLETVKALATAGIGVGLLPQRVGLPEVAKGTLIEIENNPFQKNHFGQHHLGLIYNLEKKNSPIMSELIRQIKASQLTPSPSNTSPPYS